MALWQDIPGKDTKINSKNLSRLERFTPAKCDVDSDYYVDFDGAGGLDNYDVVKISFIQAINNTKQARLSIDNGVTFYNIENLIGKDIENKEIELIFKVDEWNKLILDVKKEEYNYITAIRESATSFQITPATTVLLYPLNKVIQQKGNKLSLSNSKIIIGEGVSVVKVSVLLTVVFADVSSVLNYIYHNGNNTMFSQTSSGTTAAGSNVQSLTNSAILNVEEGDEIDLRVYTNAGTNNSIQRNAQSSITVEVME